MTEPVPENVDKILREFWQVVQRHGQDNDGRDLTAAVTMIFGVALSLNKRDHQETMMDAARDYAEITVEVLDRIRRSKQ
jgi:hypothetical protein